MSQIPRYYVSEKKEEEKSYELFEFKGTGGDYFLLTLTNTFLTVLTAGIYYFWGRVRARQYIYSKTRFAGKSFRFTARGGDRLLGFALALGILIAIGVVLVLLYAAVQEFLSEEVAQTSAIVTSCALLVFFTPIVEVGRRRFLLRHVEWNKMNFRFTGSVQELAGVTIIGGLVTLFTLGLYAPWVATARRRFFTRNTWYGNERFEYTGKPNELFWIDVKGFLLSLLTLGLFLPWWRAAVKRYHWKHTSVQGNNFATMLTGGDLMMLYLTSGLLVLFTFGLASSVVVIWRRRVHCNNLYLDGVYDESRVREIESGEASAVADGLQDAADALGSIGEFLG